MKNRRQYPTEETDRLIRPGLIAVLCALVVQMMSMSALCIELGIQADKPSLSTAFSVGAGLMLIVVAGMCLRLVRFGGGRTDQPSDPGIGRQRDRRHVQVTRCAAALCLLAASAIFVLAFYWRSGAVGPAIVMPTRCLLVSACLLLAGKSLQFGAASIVTAATLKNLSTRSFQRRLTNSRMRVIPRFELHPIHGRRNPC